MHMGYDKACNGLLFAYLDCAPKYMNLAHNVRPKSLQAREAERVRARGDLCRADIPANRVYAA
jgi:hypothetical protein